MEHQHELTNKLKQEFRCVCKNFGQAPGHHDHSYVKEGYDLARRYADKMEGEVPEFERPFAIQSRLVSEWEIVDDE